MEDSKIAHQDEGSGDVGMVPVYVTLEECMELYDMNPDRGREQLSALLGGEDRADFVVAVLTLAGEDAYEVDVDELAEYCRGSLHDLNGMVEDLFTKGFIAVGYSAPGCLETVTVKMDALVPAFNEIAGNPGWWDGDGEPQHRRYDPQVRPYHFLEAVVDRAPVSYALLEYEVGGLINADLLIALLFEMPNYDEYDDYAPVGRSDYGHTYLMTRERLSAIAREVGHDPQAFYEAGEVLQEWGYVSTWGTDDRDGRVICQVRLWGDELRDLYEQILRLRPTGMRCPHCGGVIVDDDADDCSLASLEYVASC